MAEVGDRVGPYEILDTLGTGGMGTVYLAQDVRLSRKVALKFIRSDASTDSDADMQQRVLQEARAASVLNHPNVCHVYDVGGEGRQSWIAMEYVEGAALASIIQSKGGLPPDDVVRLGRHIAAALAHAHERGVLHRDLKPANIVCDREGRPKILDFGIAGRLVQDIATEVTRSATSTVSPALAGTLAYMAPEVIRGRPQDARSDLWSLGVVLFEMLAGRPPFHGRNAFDLAAAIVQGDVAPLPDHVPAPLSRVVARLLSNDPASHGRTVIFSSARAGSRTLWQIPAAGGEPSPLTTGAGEDDHPDLTADGRQLAYTNVRNTWDLRVRDLATGHERAILQRGVEVLFPLFSPDGQRLVYFGRSDADIAVFTIGVDGSDLRQLTSGGEFNHQPRWGPDGRDIFFFQERPTVSFRRVSALGGPSTEFRPWQWVQQSAPVFERTGRFLAYLRQRPPGAPATVAEHTVIQEVASGTEQVWPEPHTHVGGWSADGSSIVGVQHNPKGGGSLNLVVICHVADASCRPVTAGGSPKWGPQGDRLYFARPVAATGAQELWTIAIDGRDERRLADLGVMRPGDLSVDVSGNGQVAWAPLRAGVHALWTAQIK